jgi:2-C-methyl-D-erythritol 4-phosphate cytidylyltransferase
MTKTELKLEYTLSQNKGTVPVIVVAAGASSRMGGTNKQLAEVGGVPVIIKTLQKFENNKNISNIILVVRDEDLFTIQMLADKYMISKVSDIVCGGKNRQESVLKGFARLPENAEKALIHDGARPFVSDVIIDSVIDGLNEYSAVTCGVKVKDTIKRVSQGGIAEETLERDSLRAIQTPQGVRVQEYLTAVENADIANFTDDTSIMEAAGHKVLIVDGDYKNIKITTKEDLILANAFASEELE